MKALLLLAMATSLAAQAPARVITVRGTVFDSLHGGPLRGALVSFPDISKSGITDSLGNFAIDSVRPGPHTVLVAHEALDSLGLTALTAQAMFLSGMPPVRINIPTYRSFWRSSCGRLPPGDSVYLAGTVRNAADDAPIANATVHLVWILNNQRLDIDERLGGISTTTDENGAYGFCGVPKNARLRLRAQTENAASGTFVIAEGRQDVRWRDLSMGSAAGDSASLGSVVGSVRQKGTGAPVGNARIVVDQTREARTDSLGKFRIDGLKPGTRQVEILSVGIGAVGSTIDVRPGKQSSVSLSVAQVQTLAAASIIARPPPSPIQLGIMERMRTGLGKYVDSTALVGRHFTRSIFEGQAGLRVVGTRGLRFLILGKDFANRDCLATVIIDGIRQADQDDLLSMSPDDIAQVEMYPRAMLVPAEMQFARQECGVIAIWTKWKLDTRKP